MPPNSLSTTGCSVWSRLEQQRPSSGSLSAEEPWTLHVGVVAAGEPFGIGVVVVDTDDVRAHAFPAVIADDWPGRIECLRQVVQRLHVVPLIRIVGQVGHAPALVDRHPGHDARVAVVAAQRLGPLAHDPLHRASGEAVGRRHLAPHQQAQPVRPVQVAGILELLVLAHTVEAHGLRQLDVAADRGVVRRGHPCVLPVALVQHHPQHVRAAVQEKAVFLQRHIPKSGIALHRVHGLTLAISQRQLGLDERGRGGVPEQVVPRVVDARVGQCDSPDYPPSHHPVPVVGEHLAPRPQQHLERVRVGITPGHRRVKADLPAGEVGRPAQHGDRR